MDVILVRVRQDGRSQDVPVQQSPLVIGRKEGVGLQVPEADVSREHCELVIGEDSVTIRDLNSSNGTFVNATRIKEAELAPGDLLAVGSCIFVVRIDGFPKMIDPASAFLEGTPPAPDTPARPPAPRASPAGPKAAIPSANPNDESSVAGFDFLDESDDDQPKL